MGDGREKEGVIATHPREAHHSRYINREFSWLQFNARVLAEGALAENPLLERLKFVAIFESNLDEFYMVRVSGLIEQFESGVEELTPDGMTPNDQLTMIARTALPLRQRASDLWARDLQPALATKGIRVVNCTELDSAARVELGKTFQSEVFPLCTPLMVDPAITFPFISNRSLNLAVELQDGKESRLARIKIPAVVPRLVPVPGEKWTFVWIEDLIAQNLDALFPGVEVVGSHPFRVLRDADVEIRELEAADLIAAVEQSLRLRRFGDPVLLEVSKGLAPRWVDVLRRGLKLDESDVFRVDGLIGLGGLHELADLPRPDLKFPRHTPGTAPALDTASGLFAAIKKRDLLLHHPFDSFGIVQTFVNSATTDPSVVGVRQTLYRVGVESPIVESLMEAGEAGKQVAAIVELKARFDENNNLVWSRALERVGVHVTYGFPEMKVHCKLCLVVRSEKDGLRTYVHVGTGNYNPSTARLYTDLGLLTCDPEVSQDATELFNYLTGFSKKTSFRKLLVAPLNLREQIIERIQKETALAESGQPAWIRFKLNSLVDPEVIDALYEASDAGVQVELVVRGICCVRPGVSGLSENIRVVSIVGRFLEHSRIYAFCNAGESEVLIGSADMMRRNLDRRVEVLVPVTDSKQRRYLVETVCGLCLADTANSWELGPEGEYRKRLPEPGRHPISAQQILMAEGALGKLLKKSDLKPN